MAVMDPRRLPAAVSETAIGPVASGPPPVEASKHPLGEGRDPWRISLSLEGDDQAWDGLEEQHIAARRRRFY